MTGRARRERRAERILQYVPRPQHADLHCVAGYAQTVCRLRDREVVVVQQGHDLVALRREQRGLTAPAPNRHQDSVHGDAVQPRAESRLATRVALRQTGNERRPIGR